MPETILTDFHCGWIIEIFAVEDGFETVSRSPIGHQILQSGHHPQAFAAWQAAIQQIDRFSACAALKGFLREWYELEQLEFEDWQTLSHSLG